MAEFTRRAFAEGICSVLIEGGPGLVAHSLGAGVVNRWYQFIAPSLIGAESGRPMTEGWGVNKFEGRLTLSGVRWRPLGPDFFVTGRLF